MKTNKSKHQEIKVSEPLRYTRLNSDSDGESHFSDQEINFELTDFAPPAPPISVSNMIKAEGVLFTSNPSGWYGDWHPTPRRQFFFLLSGELEVEVSDGEIRRFRNGDVLLLEDTFGKGHTSRLVSNERAYAVFVALSE